jgi:glucose-6-phosphate dehydrogenase assembly protein OpcA
MNRIIKLFTLTIVLSFTQMADSDVQAQCPMCKMSAESNMRAGGSAGKGLNAGILYMLVTPYLLVGTIGFIWWRNRRAEDVDVDDLLPSVDQLN